MTDGVSGDAAAVGLVTTAGDTSPTSTAQSTDGDSGFPYLILDIPDTDPVAATDLTYDESGDLVGTHTVYHQAANTASGETFGREILLRVQATGYDYPQFTNLIALAESSETVRIAGRDVTVYVIPDDAIDEGSYDLGVLHWIESPGIEAILIPWGLDRGGALDLMAGLEQVEPDAWLDLTTETDDNPTFATTTTVVEQREPTTTEPGPQDPEPDGS